VKRMLVLLLAVAPLVAYAGEEPSQGALRITRFDPIVRSAQAYRCVIQQDVPSAERQRGPFLLQVSLSQNGRSLASFETPIERLGQMQSGAGVVLFVNGELGADPLILQAVLSQTLSHERAIVTANVETPLGRKRALQQLYERCRERGALPAVVRLWIEQGAELASGAESLRKLTMLLAVNRRLSSWLDGDIPTSDHQRTGAFVDRCDGSVQPYRVHMPANDADHVPLLLLIDDHDNAPAKSDWRESPWPFSHADRAGFAVLEVYPAGDIDWSGIAVPRCLAALDSACADDAHIDASTVIVIGVGRGARGALRLAEEFPDRFAAVVLVDAKLATPANDAQSMAHWLASRRVGGMRPQNVAAITLALSGKIDASAERWRRAVSENGGSVSALVSPQEQNFWLWMSQHTALKHSPRCSGLLPAPARLGCVTVLGLEHWGIPAELRWNGDDLNVQGAKGVIIDSTERCTLNGKPYKKPRDESAKTAVKRFGRAQGPLDAYSERPFAVVYGTGESDVAAADNVTIANDFLRRWVAHAHGAPPRMADRDFNEVDFSGNNLVLIGNHRSNSVLARMVENGLQLPLSWDAREVRFGEHAFARSEHRPIALAWPHPANDGRLLIILDGAPLEARGNSTGASMPLADYPDLVIGRAPTANPGSPEETVFRLFDSDWR
jgi:pimeloyl-ACP methyl ester carboxylesterase